jgi:uroporphyrinogen-III synthase
MTMDRARRILVTRPEPGASHTARRLERMGFSPVVLPLSETTPLAFKLPRERFDAVAITSVNAVRHAEPERIAGLRHLPVYAVGDKTASAARAAGFSDVTAAGGDGAALGEMLVSTLPSGAHVLYLAGRVRRPDFEQRAKAGGLALTVCETYDTAPIDYRDLRERLSGGPIEVALVYSPAAAKALATLAERAEISGLDLFLGTQFLCLSPRIAESLPDQWRSRARVSERPDEEALINLLASL